MAFTGKATYTGGSTLPELMDDVSDIVGIVSPYETPLLDHLGDPAAEAASPRHEWLEDSLSATATQINQASFSPNALTATSVVIDEAVFRAGDVLATTSGERVLVTAVSANGLTLTLRRGFGGTTAGALADNQVLTLVANAALEGAAADDARAGARARKHNYCQILSATVEVSGTMQASALHGVRDEVDYQRQERLRELLRDLENAVINGVANATTPGGSGTERRTMNGLLAMITTNTLSPGVGGMPDGGGGGADELTEELLNAAMRRVWENASTGLDTILVNGAQKRRINSFAGAVRTAASDRVLRDGIDVYESDFGVCRVVMSRWAPRGSVVLLDSSRCRVMPMRQRSFGYRELAQVGDSVRGQVLGEYTLELRNESAHAVLSGLS